MLLFAWLVVLLLPLAVAPAHAQPTQITIVQPAEATPWTPDGAPRS